MGQRAVSPVVGMVVLVGLVAIVGLSVVIVGLSVVDGAQSTAETTQAETSMAEFASTAEDIASSRSQSGSFSFVGDDDGSTWVDESAGNMTIVVNGSDSTTIPVGDLGVYRHQTSDGTEIAYQAGGVWRTDGGEPVLITPPSFDFRQAENTSTLQLPIVTVTGDGVGGGSVDGDAQVVDRSSLLKSEDLDNPIHGDELEVRISSRYCSGWEAYVSENTPATTTESCGDGTSDRLVFTHSLPDERDSNVSDSGPEVEWWAEDAVRTAADFQFTNGSDGKIDGNVSHGGTFDVPSGVTVTDNRTISPTDVTHDSEIQSRIDDGSSWERLCERDGGNGSWFHVDNVDCSFGAGTHYVDNDSLVHGMNSSIVLDVTSGNVTLVLDDDLELQNGQGLEVSGAGSGNVARIYTDHDVIFRNHGDVGPPNPADFPDPSVPYDGNAEALQIYGSSDTDLVLGDAVHFEGVFDAPAGPSGTAEVTDNCVGSDFYVAGAIRTGEFNICHGNYEHSYDDSLSDSDLDVDLPEHNSTSTDGRFYLHATETQIEVDS